MKIRHVLIPFALLAAAALAQAQSQQIWRCGNTYTNDPREAQAKGCKPVQGGNVTIVEGTKVNKAAPAPSSGTSEKRVSSDEQKARDAEARSILDAELKKAQARRDAIAKEYNNGEPEKMGPEHKNYQKYLDRVAELKASLERADQDVAGLQRELARVSGGAQPSNPTAK